MRTERTSTATLSTALRSNSSSCRHNLASAPPSRARTLLQPMTHHGVPPPSSSQFSSRRAFSVTQRAEGFWSRLWRAERHEGDKQPTRAEGKRTHDLAPPPIKVPMQAVENPDRLVQTKGRTDPNLPTDESTRNAEPPSPPQQSVAEKDAALMQAYLDREGGSAGVGTADHWEGAMGSETRKNMFRVI